MSYLIKIIFVLLFTCSYILADKITVFAASDLKFALDNIKENFLKLHPTDEVDIIYGSSGKGMIQISRGAPYHIYFSANVDFVEKLYQEGSVVTKPKLYAIGRIVIWSKHKKFDASAGFENMTLPWARKIAIANPNHAPYGEKAKQSLQSWGIYDDVKSKLVFGENISQTAGFINLKAADIGIIALSLALAPTISNSEYSFYYLIDTKLHEPLNQAYGITKIGSSIGLSKVFYDFMNTETSQQIMKKFGFVI